MASESQLPFVSRGGPQLTQGRSLTPPPLAIARAGSCGGTAFAKVSLAPRQAAAATSVTVVDELTADERVERPVEPATRRKPAPESYYRVA